jgi:hypothetical protein
MWQVSTATARLRDAQSTLRVQQDRVVDVRRELMQVKCKTHFPPPLREYDALDPYTPSEAWLGGFTPYRVITPYHFKEGDKNPIRRVYRRVYRGYM